MNMRIRTVWAIILGFLAANGIVLAENQKPAYTLDAVLNELHESAAHLTSFESKIRYVFSQPLLESKTVRTGKVYYKQASGRSYLRIDFQKMKQDDSPEQTYVEHFIFDGIWLTHIDYQIKSIQRHQVAEPNHPANAFDLAAGNMPIIGFSQVERLKEDFDISLVLPPSADANQPVELHCLVKPDSKFEADYQFIDFWIDTTQWLPTHVHAVTTEEDVYEIYFEDRKTNLKLDDSLFEFKVPPGFPEPEIHRLKQGRSTGQDYDG